MAKVLPISSPPITKVHNTNYQVKVFLYSPSDLSSCRELRNKYQTNREIKLWSIYFLLKRIAPGSSQIQKWRSQREVILPFLQIGEKQFYWYLSQLSKKGLATVDKKHNINLVSYNKAAEIQGYLAAHTYNIPYNPLKKDVKQEFQYLLRAEELRENQDTQLNALTYNLDKNPILKNDLHLLLIQHGADGHQLCNNEWYMQQRLLLLQMQLFKEGSNILQHVFTHRADINRSVTGTKKAHNYKSIQSVTYLKRKLEKQGIIHIEKKKAVSKTRSRIYVPDATAKKGKRDGYKYNRMLNYTVWFLTDQIQFMYEIYAPHKMLVQQKKAA